MPSTTHLLAVLLGIISYFQGIDALPASSSTSSIVPESTNSLGFPLSAGSESTTALGGLSQATPTAVVPTAAKVNSTFEPRDSDPYIYPPDDVPWVEFYNNAQCDPSNNGRIKDQIKLEIGKYISGHVFLQSWSCDLFRPHIAKDTEVRF
ncbi:hypothetical protein G7Y79_00018g045970 [Physcia stellaris]|nr:hypothetical protein G7Y79_00018g045970 [Physcia stellaris]